MIYNCRGAMIIEDFFAANEGSLATPEEIRKWRYALIDLNAVESMDIKYYDCLQRCYAECNRRSQRRARCSPCCGCSKRSRLRACRMWEALVERVGWETMTFRSLAKAEDWIQTRVKEKFGIDLANPA